MDVVPTCDVENQAVLEYLLIKRPGHDYQIIRVQSADKSGISNSLLSRRSILFLAANLILHAVHLRPTLNIYQVPLKIKDNKTEIMVFVSHWPSGENGVHKNASLWQNTTIPFWMSFGSTTPHEMR